jgi:hypothetical protein
MSTRRHALTARRGELGRHMRRFHERYEPPLTPGVAVLAFAARTPHEWDFHSTRASAGDVTASDRGAWGGAAISV